MSRRLLLLLSLLLPLAVAGCPSGGASGGEVVPVGDAQVRIWPTEPGKGAEAFEAEAVQNLRGVATTRPTGAFEVGVLSSPLTFAEYPLLKGYTYKIEVEVAGYYITSSTFDYGGGSQYVEMTIEEKEVDVLDTKRNCSGVRSERSEPPWKLLKRRCDIVAALRSGGEEPPEPGR
jgi:hypothetical protein